MDKLVRIIRVRDDNGDELCLYEFERTPDPRMLGLQHANSWRHWLLDTSEMVEQVDERTYRVVATGEMLIRVDNC